MARIPCGRRAPRAARLLAAAGLVALPALGAGAQDADETTTTATGDDVVLGQELVTEEQVAAAFAREQALQAELDQTTATYAQANADLQTLLQQAIDTEARIRLRDEEIARIRTEINLRARLIYIAGGQSLLETFLGATSFNDWSLRQAFLTRASEADAALLDALAAQEADLEVDKAALLDLRGQQQVLVAQLQETSELMQAQLAEQIGLRAQLENTRSAQLDELRRQEEARRAAEAARLVNDGSGVPLEVTPGIICPVPGVVSFINDWGFPRSGGRTHKGNDMFAPYGTPLVAVMDGTILRLGNGGLGGMSVWLADDYGNAYYYAHLSAYGPQPVGQRVAQGEVIAYLGDSGNAQGGAPHLHFEIHPGGGAAVNPFPTNFQVCNR